MSSYTTVSVLLVALAACAHALTCKFTTEALHDPDVSVAPSSQQNYDCPVGDRYCVYLEGLLQTPQARNQTFSLRSCESDVKRYLTPISEKIGQNLDSACTDENKDGKKHSVGPLTYWFFCCTDADCFESVDAAKRQHNGSTNGYVNLRLVFSSFALFLLAYVVSAH